MVRNRFEEGDDSDALPFAFGRLWRRRQRRVTIRLRKVVAAATATRYRSFSEGCGGDEGTVSRGLESFRRRLIRDVDWYGMALSDFEGSWLLVDLFFAIWFLRFVTDVLGFCDLGSQICY